MIIADMTKMMRERNAELRRSADALAVAIAVALPWSTSATGILVVGWLVTLFFTLDFAALRREAATLAGGTPILLVALGALGMLWTEVSWAAAFKGFTPYAKLLVIPILLFQFRRSDWGARVLAGFLFSCTVLLVMSLVLVTWPELHWPGIKHHGVPAKDYIAQSGEFAICAFAAAYIAIDRYRTGRLFSAGAFLTLATMFLFDIFYVASSRTVLIVIPILLVLLALRQLSWRESAVLLVTTAALSAVIWTSSPYLRERVVNVVHEVASFQVNKDVTSAGLRLYFWRESLDFIKAAPIFGHGTGSIKRLFEKAAENETAVWAIPTKNPHNQILAVGIQLGLLGVAALLLMWVSHLLLFLRPGLISWIGLVIVVQNFVSSLFNSHLFDFTQGWTYVFGVGVAGGAILRAGRGVRQGRAPDRASAAGLVGLDSARSGA